MRDDRNTGSSMPAAVWFAYSPDRKGVHPQRHLAEFRGVRQADAYGGYDALYKTGRVTEAWRMRGEHGEKSTTSMLAGQRS